MLIGEFEKQLNNNIKIKSLYNVSYSDLSQFQKMLASFKILFTKKHIYKKYIDNNYDVEVAFLEGPVTTLLSSKNKETQKIAWIHNDISLVFGDNLKAKIKKVFNKKIYKKYQKLVFVSNHNLQKFIDFYDINTPKFVVHNYLDKDRILKLSREFNLDIFDKDTINFLSASRLVEQKAIDRLIDVHKELISNGYYHKFYIIGDGPLKLDLKEKIKELNVENTFVLLGQRENPYPYILKSDYFCLLSYYEGLPMSLLEAKILNKYILVTNTASVEALENYESKKIFENTKDGIYNGLKDIINNKNIAINTKPYIDENEKILNKIINVLGD